MLRSRTGVRAGSRDQIALLVAAACLAVTGAALTTGAAGAGHTATTAATTTGGVQGPARQMQPAAAARAAVRTAVREARRGAPLPQGSTPALSQLSGSRSDLGSCDYGKVHDDAGGRLCERGDASATRSLVVLGDSHGKHWVPGIETAAERHGWRSHYLVKEQCTASWVANGDPAQERPAAPWAACQQFREFSVQAVADLDPDLVVVSTSIPTRGVFTDDGYRTGQADLVVPYRQGFRELFDRLRAVTDARIVLLRDIPARRPGTDPLTCFGSQHTLRDCLSPQDSQAGRVKLVDASVAAARAAGVRVVDPTGYFCWDGDCPAALRSGLLPYRNVSHMTVDYSRHLAEALTQELRLR